MKAPNEPTFFSRHPCSKPSVLEVALLKKLLQNYGAKSDITIMFSLGGNLNQFETEPKFNYSKTNRRKYQHSIQNEAKIPTPLQHNCISINNKYIRFLNSIILNSANMPLMTEKISIDLRYGEYSCLNIGL